MSSGTASSIRFEPKEILLAEITFPDTNELKLRPVLVISNFSSIQFMPETDHFICVPITSNTDTSPNMIKIGNSDIEAGGLEKPSQVICNYIFTIAKSDVKRKKGAVTPSFYQRIASTVKQNIL